MEILLTDIEFKEIIPWIIALISVIIALLSYSNSRKQRKLNEKTSSIQLEDLLERKKEKIEKSSKSINNIENYCDYIIRQFKYISLRGIGAGGISMELNKTYIKLKVRDHKLYQEPKKYM